MYPGEEVFAAEHPIRHVFFEVPGASRLAVVFSGFERPDQPKYNYIERLAPLCCHRLHVLDDLGRRGCYYLGRDRDFMVARAIADLVDQRLAAVGLTRADVVTVGSSKGGTAALYHALAFGYGEAVAAAPQVRLGTYLTSTAPAHEVARLIAGGCDADDVAFLDRFLLDAVGSSPHRPSVHFFISREDSHYDEHLQPLLERLDARRHRYTIALGNYTTHSAVGPAFSRHVLEWIGTIVPPVSPEGNRTVGGVDGDPPDAASAPRGERLLYRGGFLVHETREPPAPRAEDLAGRLDAWGEVRVGDFTLRFDHTRPCARFAVGDVELALLGHATHVDRPEDGHQEITHALTAALHASGERFYDLLDHLSGAHLVLFRAGGRHVVLQDATGMEATLYRVGGGRRLVASHPGLIAELEDLEVSEFGRSWLANPALRAGGAYFPGLLTPYAEVRTLTPNTQLALDELRVERFFPRAPVGTVELDEVIDSVAGRLRNQWRWLVANHEVSMSLTGGLDSRLTLAAGRDAMERVHTFTYSMWANRTHEQDCVTAANLADRLGLRHDIYRIPHSEPLDPGLLAYWDRMYGGMQAGHELVNGYLPRFPAGHLHVRSNVLETTRGFYLKNRANVPDRFDVVKLSRLFRGATATEFAPAFEEFARVTAFTPENTLDIHYTDLYYWEHRMGAWHSGVVNHSKASHETFVLYNARVILNTMLARPLSERVDALHVWELMDALWPQALEEPILARGGLWTRPLRAPAGAAGSGDS